MLMSSTDDCQKSLLHSTENSDDREFQEFRNKKYVKITPEIKRDFLDLIIQHNLSIKDASEKLRINYSSAKAILSQHRKTTIPYKKKSKAKAKAKQCQFRQIDQDQTLSSSISSLTISIGGRVLSELSFPKKIKPIQKMNLVIRMSPKEHLQENCI